jgi:hypothetical protein
LSLEVSREGSGTTTAVSAGAVAVSGVLEDTLGVVDAGTVVAKDDIEELEVVAVVVADEVASDEVIKVVEAVEEASVEVVKEGSGAGLRWAFDMRALSSSSVTQVSPIQRVCVFTSVAVTSFAVTWV